MKIVHKRDSWKGLEDLIVDDARADAPRERALDPVQADILERLDYLEGAAEARVELGRLSSELSSFVADKKAELRSLRSYRFFATGLALASMLFVAGFLIYQIARGFPAFKGHITSEIILASYVAASLAFILGILLVLLRGIFGSIKEMDSANYVPPQVQEIYNALKKVKGD